MRVRACVCVRERERARERERESESERESAPDTRGQREPDREYILQRAPYRERFL